MGTVNNLELPVLWRRWAVLLGASLMLGETVRSWGQGRNPLFVVDDFLVGIPLVVCGLRMARPTVGRLCGLTASFAASAGMLYHSLFGKLVDLTRPASSNIGIQLLVGLIALAFAASLFGMVACLRVALRAEPPRPGQSFTP